MSQVDSTDPNVETSSGDGATAATAPSSGELTASAERIVQDHVLLSLAAGFIPGPGIDLAAAFAVQLTMLKRMATLYSVPFKREAAKGIVAALLGTLGGAGAAGIAAASFLKVIPLLGTVVGVAGTSVAFGAFTYAIGKVFQRHFESGGTFIDLDPNAYRDYFREMNLRGRKVAKERSAEAEDLAAEQKKRRPGRSSAAAAADA